MLLAIHIKRNSRKRPEALFSIYVQPGYRYGWSWVRKNDNYGIRLMHKNGQYWFQFDDRSDQVVKRRRRRYAYSRY